MSLEEGDIEDLLIAYLGPALVSAGFTVPVSDRKTAAECVVVYRVGGASRDLVTGFPSVMVDVYAALNSRASAICRRACSLIRDLEGQSLSGHPVYEVQEFKGPSSEPRTPDLIRYSAMIAIAVRMGVTA